MSYEERKFLQWKGKPESAFLEIMELFDKTIEQLLNLRAAPTEEKLGKIVVRRFEEKDMQTAIVLKLTVLVSNLRAGRLLIDHGFTYEWAMVRRLLYETLEDVMFLLARPWADSKSDLHQRYLAAFFAEDLDRKGRLNEKGVRAPLRSEMRKFLESVQEDINGENNQEGNGLGMPLKALYRFGSGHMHGRAASIMRLYDADSGAFCTNGMDNKEYLAGELRSFWTILFAAILCFGATRGQVWGAEYMNDVFAVAEEFAGIAELGLTTG